MTFGSLFAGIGGFDLGFERAGMRCAWQVEVDPYAREILTQHWPEVSRWGDIRLFDPEQFGLGVDLICGGFPCQDLSSAATNGERRGLAGPRSGLWREFHRVIVGVHPVWAIIENSPEWYRWMPSVRADLARDGYASVPLVLSAGQVGAPHSRPRGFVVAHADGQSEPLCAFDAEMARLCAIPRSPWPPRPTERLPVDDGISRGLALKALGNALVPQVAELIGNAILACS